MSKLDKEKEIWADNLSDCLTMNNENFSKSNSDSVFSN